MMHDTRTILCGFALLLSACSASTVNVVEGGLRGALASQDLRGADSILNLALDTRDGNAADKDHFTDLFLAERGMIRLSADRYKESAIDLERADKLFDIHDLRDEDVMREMLIAPRASRRGVHMGWLGSLYEPYDPRLHERLMLNGLGMLAYLDLGDAEDARVESRRLDVMSAFAEKLSPESPSHRTRAFTGILAGFAFDHGGDPVSACRAYREAELAAPFVDVTPLVPGGAHPIACPSEDDDAAKKKSTDDTDETELLLVVAYGLVPHAWIDPFQKPETMPTGGGGTMTLPRHAQLVEGSDGEEAPRIEVDGKAQRGVAILNLADVVRDDFAQANREVGGCTAPASWSSLPARFVVARVAVSPGTHHVELAVRGATKTLDLDVARGDFAATSLVVLH